jgi:deoxyribodipyrimidine photo-lyase
MSNLPSIVWFRNDLRLADQPALTAAVQRGGPVLPVYILAADEEGRWSPGGASRWWLHHSLLALDRDLVAMGSRLILRRGPSLETLGRLVEETGADAVFWNRRYEPAIVERDGAIKAALRETGVEGRSFGGGLLHEPWTISTKRGDPYRVFTPFWKAALGTGAPGEPLPAPSSLELPDDWPASDELVSFDLEPRHDWAARFPGLWNPGAEGASARLDAFLESGLDDYEDERDLPQRPGTSGLSPHLHFGEISPREVWYAVRAALEEAGGSKGKNGDWQFHPFLTELGWREFAHHLLYHFPDTTTRPLRPEFEAFPWREDPQELGAWQEGRTGYPIVDAGMRQLWKTGWMHNRVRMVTASFLVKHLLLPWSEGARWFWDTLVDADLANNTLGWQWSAGCGADAAPYFRIFNPILQGERFDPEGDYVREWVPELRTLDAKWIHSPWEAPEEVLDRAGIRLGQDYPRPLVNHRHARNRALEAYRTMRSA